MKLGLAALWALAFAAAAPGAGADPAKAIEVSGRIVDVDESDEGAIVVILAIGDDEELSLLVGSRTKLTVDGESVPTEDLWDCLGADARASYRAGAKGAPLLETITVSWPGEDEPE